MTIRSMPVRATARAAPRAAAPVRQPRRWPVALRVPGAFLRAGGVLPDAGVRAGGHRPEGTRRGQRDPADVGPASARCRWAASRAAFAKLSPTCATAWGWRCRRRASRRWWAPPTAIALSKWQVQGLRELIFTLILFGIFIPYQACSSPGTVDEDGRAAAGRSAVWLLVHVIYGIAITTLVFRNYYIGVPDGGCWSRARMDMAPDVRALRGHRAPAVPPAFVVVLIWQFTRCRTTFCSPRC